MEEIKVGDVVKFVPWIVVNHLQSIWLRFDERQMDVLRLSKFRVDCIFRHAKFGMVAQSVLVYMPPLTNRTWLDWSNDNYVKLCYLEVTDERT